MRGIMRGMVKKELNKMLKIRNISVIGLGKLGLCMAACFACKGFKVIGVDIDIEKINKINKGMSPIEETSLEELILKLKGKLSATDDYKKAILASDTTFIVVATPSLADGSFSNEYLEKTLYRIAEVLRSKKDYHLVVITSTVMPQTTEKVAKFILEKVSGKKCGKDFGLAYNPELIALGSVIRDFFNPDFILIGEMNKRDGDILEEIYQQTCENKARFARMSPVNAEITKISLNCYVTTKITFANSVAYLCERVEGADANVVTQALGLDRRIGSSCIRPGLGYGGPCFPRDNVAFSAFARRLETQAKLAEMVDVVNREQPLRIINRIKEVAAVLKKGKKALHVGILGLSYKPNTPVIEDSQALDITLLLVQEGFSVTVYDPQGMENSRSVLGDRVRYAKDIKSCVSDADIGVIAVPWEEFRQVDYLQFNKHIILLDCWNFLPQITGVKVVLLGKKS